MDPGAISIHQTLLEVMCDDDTLIAVSLVQPCMVKNGQVVLVNKMLDSKNLHTSNIYVW